MYKLFSEQEAERVQLRSAHATQQVQAIVQFTLYICMYLSSELGHVHVYMYMYEIMYRCFTHDTISIIGSGASLPSCFNWPIFHVYFYSMCHTYRNVLRQF